MNTLGKLLKFRRTGWKMTTKEVAQKIGVSYQCLWQIEETEKVTSIDTLEKLSKFFYFDIIQLIELNYKNTRAYKRHAETIEFYKRKKENEKTNSGNN